MAKPKLNGYLNVLIRLLFNVLLSLILISFILILYFTHFVSVVLVIGYSFMYTFIKILRDKIVPKKK